MLAKLTNLVSFFSADRTTEYKTNNVHPKSIPNYCLLELEKIQRISEKVAALEGKVAALEKSRVWIWTLIAIIVSLLSVAVGTIPEVRKEIIWNCLLNLVAK